MAILVEEKLILLHLPRTAGTWARSALPAAGLSIRVLGDHRTLTQLTQLRKGRMTAAFVRDPADWYASWWAYRRLDHDIQAHGRQWSDEFSSVITDLDAHVAAPFAAWVYATASRTPLTRLGAMFATDVDRVGKIENHDTDLCLILDDAGFDYDAELLADYPHINFAPERPRVSEEVRSAILDAESAYATRHGYAA